MGVAEWVILAIVVVGFVAALFGWDRYRSSRQPGGESFAATDEVFSDPTSGKTMRVWYDAATGDLEYRPD